MRVGIVGAGITGLALHHYLDELDVESVIFEAQPEPGGVIKTVTHKRHVLDLGPQRTRLTPTVMDVIEEFDLSDEVINAAEMPQYIYHSGKLRRVPKRVGEALTTDLLSWHGKLRALLEPFTGPPRAGETVEKFLTRSFGPEVAEYFAGPLYGGLYGSYPDDMYVEHSLSKALERANVSRSILFAVAKALFRGFSPPPVGSFVEGMQTLPRTMYEAYADTIHLNTPVTNVVRRATGFELEAGNRTESVDGVVFTTPAGVTALLLEEVSPVSARHLQRLNYNPFVVVHLRSSSELHGAGYQIPFTEPHKTLGVTWNASLLHQDGIYTCFLGGAKAPDLVDRPDADLEVIAAEEFEEVTGCTAQPLHVHRLRPGMPAYDTTWTALDTVELPDGVWLCTNYTARAGIPGRIQHARRVTRDIAEWATRTPTVTNTGEIGSQLGDR